MATWEIWVRSTWLSHWVLGHAWSWQVLETLHYFGLCLLFGTVGLFDLRVLGIAKRLPPAALHRLVPWGVGGFLLNAVTGIAFFSGYPEQYAYNSAFHVKVIVILLAGVNVAIFYSWAFRKVRTLQSGDDAPGSAKWLTGLSLASWITVLACGRLLTFFRPPFFH